MNKILLTIVVVFSSFTVMAAPLMGADDSSSETESDVEVTLQQRREERLEQLSEKRAENQERIQDAREEAIQKREEFRTNLQEIRDDRKRAIVERVDEKLQTTNERWTSRWTRVLERLSEILGKIAVRADSLSDDYDTSTLREDIAEAETKIAEAQEAVDEQASKVYTIEITDESTLRGDVGAVIAELRNDLSLVKDTIESARQSVRDAFNTLKDLHNDEE